MELKNTDISPKKYNKFICMRGNVNLTSIQIVRNRFVYQISNDLFLTLKTLLANVE